MASSSKSKKPRSNETQRRQSTTLEPNPLDLARLLSTDQQRQVFTQHFLHRTIFPPKYGKFLTFEASDFNFPTILKQQKLFDFCEMNCAYYPELVKVFYCNLDFKKNKVFTSVKGNSIVLDLKTLSSICGNIPFTGTVVETGIQCDLDGYNRKEFYYSLCRFSKREIEERKQRGLRKSVSNRDILAVGNLTLEDRLIHYFLSYVVVPKFSNHSQVNDVELQLMYAIKHNIPINWTLMIMIRMKTFRDVQSPLPYAILITAILEHFQIPLDGEFKVELDPRDSKIDLDVVHKMSFYLDPTDMIYKNLNDQPAMENPPAENIESSSSSTMPTNQMIMDELFSLRGYITTRMDTLDARYQHVQDELKRLSNRMDYMDLDAESDEPES